MSTGTSMKKSRVFPPPVNPQLVAEAYVYLGRKADGWWAPPNVGEHEIVGILNNRVPGQKEIPGMGMLILELLQPCDYVANLYFPGVKGACITVPTGCLVAVTEWTQFTGLWPLKAGHKIVIKRSDQWVNKDWPQGDYRIWTSRRPIRNKPFMPTMLATDAYQLARKSNAEVRANVRKPKSMPNEMFDLVMNARSKALMEIGALDQFLINWPKS